MGDSRETGDGVAAGSRETPRREDTRVSRTSGKWERETREGGKRETGVKKKFASGALFDSLACTTQPASA